MRSTTNPAEFDHIGDIITTTYTIVNGERTATGETKLSDIRSKQLLPLRGSETEETNQNVAIERKSWQIRKENWTIVPKDTKYVVGGKDHHLTGVREYKGERYYLVLDTEYRDNQ